MSDFGERVKETFKILAPIGLAASYIFPPVAAITVPLTVVGVVGGATAAGIGYATDNDKMKRVGMDVLEVTAGAGSIDPTGQTGYALDKAVGLKK